MRVPSNFLSTSRANPAELNHSLSSPPFLFLSNSGIYSENSEIFYFYLRKSAKSASVSTFRLHVGFHYIYV